MSQLERRLRWWGDVAANLALLGLSGIAMAYLLTGLYLWGVTR